ncbi:MAG: hypothetical protein ACPG5Z_13570, partial [Pseudoalteromonas sp.]
SAHAANGRLKAHNKINFLNIRILYKKICLTIPNVECGVNKSDFKCNFKYKCGDTVATSILPIIPLHY